MRVDSSDEEIEIRVRLPEEDRVLSTLDTLKVRTPDGLIPLSNFITRTPVPKLAEISRVGQKRYLDIKADVATGLMKIVRAERVDGIEVLHTLGTARPAANDAEYNNEDGDGFKIIDRSPEGETLDPVSYTHLTLPTIYSV